MRFSRACLVLCVVVLQVVTGAHAQESDPQASSPAVRESPEDRSRNRTFERLDQIDRLSRARALSRLATTGTLVPDRIEPNGPDLDVVRRAEAREDLMALAGGLQALYDLGAIHERDDEFWRQVDAGTKGPVEAARKVLEFVNRGTDPRPPGLAEIQDESFDDRVLHLVRLYVSLVDPIAEFIEGDVLDLGKLEQVRTGLSELETLTRGLPESNRSVNSLPSQLISQ